MHNQGTKRPLDLRIPTRHRVVASRMPAGDNMTYGRGIIGWCGRVPLRFGMFFNEIVRAHDYRHWT